MASVRVQNVTKEFGGQRVLTDASVEFSSGEIVGLVGPNGCGKTTLFRLIAGELDPDIGTVTRSKGLSIGYLRQEPTIDPAKTLFDEVADAFDELRRLEHRQHDLAEQIAAADGADQHALMEEYDRTHERFLTAGGYAFETRLNEILGGLGFVPRDYELPMSALSGGQQCRAALAKLLLQENTFLLLDEPTNHLDIDAVAWLERYLAGHQGGAVIISHDRYLLDRVADRIVELDRRTLHSFPGSYTNYVQSRDVRRLSQQRQYEQDQAFIAKERAFINKHMGKQRTAEAKGRLTRLERRIRNGEFVMERPIESRRSTFSFGQSEQPRGWVVDIQELAKAYGDKRLFADLTLQVQAAQRVGITGPNGTGKTTLLRVLLGEVAPDAGRVRIDPHARVGYFSQDGGGLDEDRTVIEELMHAYPGLTEQRARDLLGAFRFVEDEPFKQIRQLSGGERSRLRMLKLMLEEPNMLVLDEPTNHLDIPSREALEAALEKFPGAVVCVSHDRYFLDKLAQRLLVIRPAEHTVHSGNYSSYAAALERAQETRRAAVEQRPSKRSDRPKGERPRKKKSAFAWKKVSEIEEMIFAREERVAEIHRLFSDPDVCREHERVNQLQDELVALQNELAELHAAWESKIE